MLAASFTIGITLAIIPSCANLFTNSFALSTSHFYVFGIMMRTCTSFCQIGVDPKLARTIVRESSSSSRGGDSTGASVGTAVGGWVVGGVSSGGDGTGAWVDVVSSSLPPECWNVLILLQTAKL